MDTSRDYRFLVAERAVEKYPQIVRTSGLPYEASRDRLLGLAKEAYSVLMSLKYSFLPLDQLLASEMLRRLSRLGGEMARFVTGKPLRPLSPRDRYNRALILWIGRTLAGLPLRLRLGEENRPEYAVDVYAARVESLSRLGERLWVANVYTGRAGFTVVTNLGDVRKGEVRGVAVLPPRLFGDVVSEAMFCTGPLGVEPGTRPREVSGEVAAIVEEIVERGL